MQKIGFLFFICFFHFVFTAQRDSELVPLDTYVSNVEELIHICDVRIGNLRGAEEIEPFLIDLKGSLGLDPSATIININQKVEESINKRALGPFLVAFNDFLKTCRKASGRATGLVAFIEAILKPDIALTVDQQNLLLGKKGFYGLENYVDELEGQKKKLNEFESQVKNAGYESIFNVVMKHVSDTRTEYENAINKHILIESTGWGKKQLLNLRSILQKMIKDLQSVPPEVSRYLGQR
jgi:hypothetical protein